MREVHQVRLDMSPQACKPLRQYMTSAAVRGRAGTRLVVDEASGVLLVTLADGDRMTRSVPLAKVAWFSEDKPLVLEKKAPPNRVTDVVRHGRVRPPDPEPEAEAEEPDEDALDARRQPAAAEDVAAQNAGWRPPKPPRPAKRKAEAPPSESEGP